MPTYEYECQKCQHKFEIFQSMTAEPLTKCPKCGGKIKRLIGAGGGIICKGSGFYATDHRKDKRKEEKPCEKASPDCPSNCPHA